MRDSQGLCVRRQSFSQARSGVSRLKRSRSVGCNEISHSELDLELCQYYEFSADNGFSSPSNAFRPNLVESVSAIWLKTTIDLKSFEPRQSSGLPKRSRSCNGRIGASFIDAQSHIGNPVSLCTYGRRRSRSSSFHEPGSSRQSRGLKDREIFLDFLPCERFDSSTKEDKTRDILVNNHLVEDRAGKSDLLTKRQIDNEKATISPLPVLIQKTAKASISTVPMRTVLSKRSFEEDDDAEPIVPNSTKPTGCAKPPKRRNHFQGTPKKLRIETSESTLEILVRIKQEPSALKTKSPGPSVEPEQHRHPDTGPAHFVSALDIFNELIPGCDATSRFQEEPGRCLANNKHGLRCRERISFEKQQKIKWLLAELAELNLFVETQQYPDKLVAFTKSAVCFCQRKGLIQKFKSRHGADRFETFARASPITADSSGSALTRLESGLNLAQKGMAVGTPVVMFSTEVNYWLREQPGHALQYLPEYQPYHHSKQHPKSVREWVVEKAKNPLSVNRRTFHEGDDGYLYVYWNRASFGLVKIGCTKNTVGVDKRLQDWERQCRHLVEEHYRSPFQIKHVKRLEKLIHTEFREYRVFEPKCRGCGDKHIEWFRGLDLALLRERIEVWTEWIMTEPYEGKSGHWGLKPSLESTIPQSCAALNEIDSPKGKATILKTPRRYNLRRRRAPGSFQKSAASYSNLKSSSAPPSKRKSFSETKTYDDKLASSP